MRKFILLAVLFSAPSLSFAQGNRQALINQQLDCVAANEQSGTINWSDVCYMGTIDEHKKAVASALDMFEQSAPVTSPVPAISAPAEEKLSSQESGRVAKRYKTLEDMPDFVKQKLDPRHVHTFSFDAEPYYYRYHEDIGVTISGMMMGYTGKYEYRPEDSNWLNNFLFNTYGAEVRYATADLDYKSSNGVINDKKNINVEARATVGKDYLLGDSSIVTPYFGYGYRFLYDEGNNKIAPDGSYGYDRRSHYFYLPLGVSVLIPDGNWSSALNFEYDIFLGGVQFSDLNAVPVSAPFAYENLRNPQEQGYGVRGSIKLMYKNRNINFFVEPFIRYWNIDDSKVMPIYVVNFGQNGSGLEPHNYTMEIGSKFGLLF